MSITSNPASVVEESTFTVRRTVRIAASVDKVWAAVTEPQHISRWFGKAVFDGAGVGALGTLSWEDHGSIPVRIETIDKPRSISYRWSNDDAAGKPVGQIDEENSTVFTFTLQQVSGGTELTVVETGFEATSAPLANLESHRGGWDFELDELVELLESQS